MNQTLLAPGSLGSSWGDREGRRAQSWARGPCASGARGLRPAGTRRGAARGFWGAGSVGLEGPAEARFPHWLSWRRPGRGVPRLGRAGAGRRGSRSPRSAGWPVPGGRSAADGAELSLPVPQWARLRCAGCRQRVPRGPPGPFPPAEGHGEGGGRSAGRQRLSPDPGGRRKGQRAGVSAGQVRSRSAGRRATRPTPGRSAAPGSLRGVRLGAGEQSGELPARLGRRRSREHCSGSTCIFLHWAF